MSAYAADLKSKPGGGRGGRKEVGRGRRFLGSEREGEGGDGFKDLEFFNVDLELSSEVTLN